MISAPDSHKCIALILDIPNLYIVPRAKRVFPVYSVLCLNSTSTPIESAPVLSKVWEQVGIFHPPDKFTANYHTVSYWSSTADGAKLPLGKLGRVTACGGSVERLGDNSVAQLEIIAVSYSGFHEQTKVELEWGVFLFAHTITVM